MRTVWKKELSLDTGFGAMLPVGSKVIDCQLQKGSFCIWFECDHKEEEEEARQFSLVGTGNYVDKDAVYISTVHSPPYVWHIYEEVVEVK